MGTIRLVPVPAAVVRACRDAQRKVQVTILCPTMLPRPSRTQEFGDAPDALGASGFPGIVNVGYGVEGDTAGRPLSFNDPRRFLHFVIQLADQPVPPGARAARLGGRRGMLARATPGGYGGSYFGNHVRFIFAQRGVRYAATLHTFGERDTERLLGRILQTLRPASDLTAPVAPPGTEAVTVPTGGTGLEFAAGSIWLASTGSFNNPSIGLDHLTRIDPATRIPTDVSAIGRSSLHIASGEGAVWATHQGNAPNGDFAAPALTRIDPATTALTTAAIGDPRDTPQALVAGAGAVWVAVARRGASLRFALVRIDPTSLRPIARVPLPDRPRLIAGGAGRLWIAPCGTNRVTVIDTHANRRLPTLSVGHQPSGMTFAAGSLWVADERDDAVRRIDPRTGGASARIPIGGPAFRLTAGPAGIWAPVPGRGEVVLIDPVRARVTRRIRVGGDPVAALEVDGSLWIAMNSDDLLMRLPL